MVKAGARIHLLDSFVQGPIKSDPISKDSPENVAVLGKDPPESQPIEKIANTQAPSQETEEIGDSFDFRK